MGAFTNVSDPMLDFRGEGKHFKFEKSSTNVKYYNFSHEPSATKISFFGVALYAWNSNLGDTVNMWTEYTIDGGTTWKRYKKFAKNFNIFPKVEMKDIIFPTTPTNGVRLVIEYTNTGISDVDFFINLYNFVDQQTVDPAQGQEGIDW